MTDALRPWRGFTLRPGAHRGVARLTALLLVMTAAGAGLTAGATLAAAAITTPFAQVYSINTTGDIQIRGNTLMTCRDLATSCIASRNTAGGGSSANAALNDNNYAMVYVDTDGDPSTFNSSSSTVNLPAGASVRYAGLVWGGRPAAGGTIGGVVGAAAPTPGDTNKVKLQAPGQSFYSNLTASTTATNSGNYQSFLDVTSIVQAAGNGSYSVANVQSGQGGDSYAGWGLAIAYFDTNAPSRNLTIFRGYGSVASGESFDMAVSGFTTPPAGTVRTTLGAVSYEGDLGSTGDQLLLGATALTVTNVSDALHASTNVFDSTISDNGADTSTRTPNYRNQLGFDAATFNVDGKLPNSATSAVIRVTSSSETYYPGLITFATELYAPNIDTTKAVAVVKQPGNTNAGLVEPGDQLEYTLVGTNNGNDIAAGTVLSDPMPAGTTYVPGSMKLNGSTLTDAPSDDVGRYNSVTKKAIVNLGAGATSASGGTVALGASTGTFTFRVTVDSPSSNNLSIVNTASVNYSGFTTGQAVSGASSTVIAVVVQHHSELSIAKSADLAGVQKGAGTTVTYTLTATNAGPYDDPGVTVTDTLPSGATFGTITPSSGSCALPVGQTVTCNLGSLANAGTATVAVRAVLDGSADPATDTAIVSGTNLDSDSSNNTATKSTVVNTVPVAVPDSATTSGGTATINVSANDTDADGNTLTVSAPGGTAPARGTVVVTGNNVIYTASAGQAGTDTFSYTVNDGRGGTATALVTVTIPNQVPDAVDDASSTTQGNPVTVPVLGNDTDPNIPTVASQALTVTGVTQPAGGVGLVTTNGTTVTFAPAASFAHGTATFTYAISDGAGGTDTATVTITMANIDAVAAADTAATTCITSVDIDVLANDSDPNGDPLTVTAVTVAAHGAASVIGAGASTKVRYLPSAGWSGAEVLQYSLFDGTSTVTGQLTVTTASCGPTAGSFSSTVSGGASANFDVLAHVTDPDTLAANLSVVGTSGPSHGSVMVNSSNHVIYLPDPTYAGPDSFTYTASDQDNNISTATVTLTVLNQLPTAATDSALVPINGSVDIPVLGNDTDPNLDTLTVSVVSTPGHGTAAIQSNGSVRYLPDNSYFGTDSFTYTISDGQGGTDSATVNVSVANVPPVAAADSAVATGAAGSPVTIDVRANDTDVNGDPVTLAAVSIPNHGATAIVGGKVVYTPDAGYSGPDTFSYDLTDGRGGMATGTVTVDVRNRAPVATADSASVASAVSATVDVTANDSDPDSEAITVTTVSVPAHGSAVITSAGRIRYTPATGFQGTDTFTYVITDPRGATDTATVTVTVTNANPVAADVAVSTPGGTPVVIDLLRATSDADGQPLQIVIADSAGHGTVSIDSSGKVTYTPQPGFMGEDSFTYLVSDGQGGFATARVTVTVGNSAPDANDDAAITSSNTPVRVNVVANDSDPNSGQALHVTTARIVSGKGTVKVTSDGLVQVTPEDGYVGQIVVSYSISDGAGGTAAATVRVRVTKPGASLPGPAALNASATIEIGQQSVTLDPADTVKHRGALAVMSTTQPTKGVTVSLVDGKLVLSRKGGFTGEVDFTYVVVGEDGVTVTVHETVRALGADQGRDNQPSVLPHTGASSVVPIGLLGLALLTLGAIACLLAVRRNEEG